MFLGALGYTTRLIIVVLVESSLILTPVLQPIALGARLVITPSIAYAADGGDTVNCVSGYIKKTDDKGKEYCAKELEKADTPPPPSPTPPPPPTNSGGNGQPLDQNPTRSITPGVVQPNIVPPPPATATQPEADKKKRLQQVDDEIKSLTAPDAATDARTTKLLQDLSNERAGLQGDIQKLEAPPVPGDKNLPMLPGTVVVAGEETFTPRSTSAVDGGPEIWKAARAIVGGSSEVGGAELGAVTPAPVIAQLQCVQGTCVDNEAELVLVCLFGANLLGLVYHCQTLLVHQIGPPLGSVPVTVQECLINLVNR